MSATSMSEPHSPAWAAAPRVNHWVYESVPGQITGCDGEGRVLVAIPVDATFASRLAAAFYAASGPLPLGGARPAFPV